MKLPRVITSNSTSILSGLACAGLVATVTLAVRATPAAMERINNIKDKKASEAGALLKDQDVARNEDLTYVEMVQATWRDYLPAGITAGATIACILGANQIGLKRNAALLGAYTLVDGAFREYKDEVLKVIGDKKEREVSDNLAEKHVQSNPPDSQVIILGGGDQLCYDDLSGRYFHSDAEAVRRAENDLRTTLLNDMFVDHNAWYSLLGLEQITLGEALGWNINHQPEVILSSHLTPDGRPCLAVKFRVLPIMDYLKY